MSGMNISPATTPPPADASISPSASIAYWNSVSANDTGMLGGYPQISRTELQTSANFLAKLRRKRVPCTGPISQSKLFNRAVDCGAGIGRVTTGLLCDFARVVDIVEPVAKFTDEITKREGAAQGGERDRGRIGDVYNVGLESWSPSVTYDLFWNQWCLGHLTDAQLVDYLVRCTDKLETGGWIIVKENITTLNDEGDLYDETDSSVTRSNGKFLALFGQAHLKIVASELQRGLPRGLGLYPIIIYALQPK